MRTTLFHPPAVGHIPHSESLQQKVKLSPHSLREQLFSAIPVPTAGSLLYNTHAP